MLEFRILEAELNPSSEGLFKKRTERTNTGQLAWLVGDRAGRERLGIQVHYQPQHLLTARCALITWGGALQ